MSITVKKVYEFDIRDDCWGGAKERIESLTDELVDELSGLLDDPSLWENGEDPDGIPEETTVNDFIWFDDDTYAEWLGFRGVQQMWDWCELINNGVDEDEIWEDEDESLVPEGTLMADFDVYKSENPDWEEDYSDFEDWAEDNGYSKFERG